MYHIIIAICLIIITFSFVSLEYEIDRLKDKSNYISKQYQDIIKSMTDIYIHIGQTRKELEKMRGEK